MASIGSTRLFDPLDGTGLRMSKDPITRFAELIDPKKKKNNGLGPMFRFRPNTRALDIYYYIKTVRYSLLKIIESMGFIESALEV